VQRRKVDREQRRQGVAKAINDIHRKLEEGRDGKQEA
jgi:hypothetical protein